MEPYYDHAGITIYNEDARWIADKLEGDVVVTDPPWGLETSTRPMTHYDNMGGWEDSTEYIEEHYIPLVRDLLTKVGRGAVTPGVVTLRSWMIDVPPAGFGGFFNASTLSPGPWGFQAVTPILYYGADPHMERGKMTGPNGRAIYADPLKPTGHPCPKPYNGWQWLVCKVSKEGETVIDPFMGSGTTLLAAKNNGRKAIGVEINERYCEIAAKRLSQEVMNFDDPR